MDSEEKKRIADLSDIVDERAYLQLEQSGTMHPVVDLIKTVVSSSCDNKCRYNNVLKAYRFVKSYDNKWIQAHKDVICGSDVSSSSAALGELRCYGCLIEAFPGNNVRRIQEKRTPTPDFVVNFGNTSVSFEVNTLNMNGDEFDSLNNYYNSPMPPKGIYISEHSTIPYGNKRAETVNENVIHKLTQVKGKEHQTTEAKQHVLWIDIQNDYMNILGDRADTSEPVFTGLGTNCNAFFSNELWYSCYGRKGYPLFENNALTDIHGGIEEKSIPILKHSGKFVSKKSSKYDAVVFSFPCRMVMYENPYSKKLPDELFAQLSSLNVFSYQSSMISYPNSKMYLKARVFLGGRRIKRIASKKVFRF